MDTKKVSVKLLIDKKGQRVLFGEAGKELVDFLFHIFSLPLGILIELLGSKEMVGCLGKLKESIETLGDSHLQAGIKKNDIFCPKKVPNADFFLLSDDDDNDDDDQWLPSKTLYRCCTGHFCTKCHGEEPCETDGEEFTVETDYYIPRSPRFRPTVVASWCRSYVTQYPNVRCPCCSKRMKIEMRRVVPLEKNEKVVEKKRKRKAGFVKEVTYMVMDDLVLKPMSTISSITLLTKFGVKDLSDLEEKTVTFGKDEAIKLLKASLLTDKVLTSVFLGKNMA